MDIREIKFDFKKSSINKAIFLAKTPFFKFSSFFAKFSFLLFLLTIIVGISNFLQEKEIFSFNFGFSILFFCLTLFFLEVSLFLEREIKKPELPFSLASFFQNPNEINLADFLDFNLAKIFREALKFSKKKKIPLSEDLFLYFILKEKKLKDVSFILARVVLSPKILLKKLSAKIKESNKKENFKEILFEAGKISLKFQRERITIKDCLLVLAEKSDCFQKTLAERRIQSEDFFQVVLWCENLEKELEFKKGFWKKENLLKKGTLGRNWAAGYTINLDNYAIDITELERKRGFPKIFGHQEEISELERILQKKEQNNVLLVGEPGVGRKAVIRAVAQKSFFGKSFPDVNYKRFLEIDIFSLVAQAPSLERVDQILDNCFKEAIFAKNVILVIDNFHNFISSEGDKKKIDISGILARYLHLATFQLIAITTYEKLHQVIERNRALLDLFEKIEVKELSKKETLTFLENIVFSYEKKYKIFFSYQSLREIIDLSDQYLPNRFFPKKAIELLDELAIYLQEKNKKIAFIKDVDYVLSKKVEIPLGALAERERKVLLNLEKLIHQRVINQEEGVKEISRALRRARAQIKTRKGPIGSFLFLGPTGVGKTETAKALAEIYFGSEERMIRLDMSEFQNLSDIERLLGNGSQEGLLTVPVRENPFSLVLLDELEKAHQKILNLFLQVLDEGYIRDGQGRKVDFRNTIIIATSNAGAEIIREDIKKDMKLDLIKEELLDFLLKNRVFTPEFINRFDSVVVFKPLTKDNLVKIAGLMLKKLAKNLKKQGIEIEIEEKIKEKLAELGYSPEFGAREMRRVLQERIENILARAILEQKIKSGDKVRLKVEKEQFKLEID